jgi:hypothetical protein
MKPAVYEKDTQVNVQDWFILLKFKNLVHIRTVSVVWWSEFLTTDAEVPGSIPGDTRFF